MRFLCEQCKAKYQISDDKVAGKTVRMKCRKCGHMIEVRSDVTETSVANAAPAAVAQPIAAGAAAKPGTLPRPATKPIPPRSKLATNLTSSPPAKAAPQNPSALAGAFQRTVAGAPASSMRPAQNPDDSQALDMLSASANPWYVAINGVPVGPVRLSELRRKAQSGIVTESSLVWQEGVEEWRPVKTFPELAQIVREAAATGRPSLVPGAGDRVSQMPMAPQGSNRPAPVVARQQPGAPRAPVAPARNNVVAIGSRSAAAEQIDEDLDFEVDDRDKTTVDAGHASPAAVAPYAPAVRPSVAPDPFAVPPAASPMAAQQGNFAGTMVMPGGPSAPMAAPVFNQMSPGANAVNNPYRTAAPISIAPAGLAPKRQVNVIALALIFAATAFGITAAVVVFSRPTAAPAASAAPTVSAAPSANGSIASSDIPPPSSAEPVDSAVAITTPDKPGTHSSGGGKTPAAGTTAKAVDPSIAALLHGESGGPAIGGGSGGPSAGTAALNSSEIEAVVNNRKVGVTRTCWERNNGSLSSANVTCHVTIAANGTVSSSQADGSDPVVAKCIETQVKSWMFPASSGPTQVNLPFHFVRQ